MSDKIVKKHQNITNRARPRDGVDKKVVYKSVLENPFRVEWPFVSPNVQNMLLAQIVQRLDGVSAFQGAKHAIKQQGRKWRSEGVSPRKPRGDNGRSDHQETTVRSDQGREITKPTCNSKSLEILHHITVGINEVTRDLERHAKAARQTLASGGVTSDNGAHNCSKLVLVCRGDINPQILISHLPQLVASCNFPSSYEDHSLRLQTVWLIPLARGAEESLAEALGLRRASVLTMNSTAPDFPELLPLLSGVPILTPSWARANIPAASFNITPTHIKQLRTTAPKNIKEARQKKAEAKTVAKTRRKALSGKITTTVSRITHRDIITPKS